MEDRMAAKLLGLAAVAANSAAADLAPAAAAGAGVESEEDEEDRWSRHGSGDSGSYGEGSEEDDEEDDGAGGKRKRMSADDRKARNRERNRLHARKTRQRKKQHVQELQLKIWGLRQERQRLLQLFTEHRTAGVLLALSCSPEQCIQGSGPSSQESQRSRPAPKLPTTAATAASRSSSSSSSSSNRDWDQEVASHEDALRKITQEFESMDGSQQAGEEEEAGMIGRGRAHSSSSSSGGGGKGGSRGVKGTLADRTALRRERNRMHAKRTRNRKKLFVEACSVMIDKMKVENEQLEHEIRASGIHLPQDNWTEEVRETIPEEPLPEYLAALWDFAEGKSSHSTKAATGVSTTATTLVRQRSLSGVGTTRQSRQTSSSSSSSAFSCATSSSSAPAAAVLAAAADAVATSSAPLQAPGDTTAAAVTPGQALEDATALCAFMEAAQTRSAKRSRVAPSSSSQHESILESAKQQTQTQPRGWSDHGSTTSESRGGSEFSAEEDSTSYERKSTDGSGALSSSASSSNAGAGAGAVLSPEFWTSRQVLERYVLPRQQLLQG